MASETYTLYDIPTKEGPQCWSPNVWKARGMLNVKKVPYKTEWVEYPDIQVVLPKLGISPLDDNPPYTLPLLRIERKDDSGKQDTEYLRDSADIAEYINKKYPEPAVDMTGPVNDSYSGMKNKAGTALRGLIITAVPDYLPERSAEYFHRTRSASFGCTLAEFRSKSIEEGAWATLEAWLEEMKGVVTKNGRPFFAGESLSAIDLRLMGILKWAEVTGHPEDYQRIMKIGGKELETFYAAAKKAFCQQVD